MAKPSRKPSHERRIPQPGGGYLVPGAGGGPQPGSGRPPGTFREFMARLRANPKVHEAVELAASDPSSRGFASALKLMADYDVERPGQKLELEHSGAIQVVIQREGRRIPRKEGK